MAKKNVFQLSGFSFVVAAQLIALAPSLVHAESEAQAESQTQAITTAGALAVTATGIFFGDRNFQNMMAAYQRHSVIPLVAADQNVGSLLNMNDIDVIAREVVQGDEVRITYRLSEIEERAVRIEGATTKRNALTLELNHAKSQLRGPMASSMAQKVIDLADAVSDLDHEISDLQAGRITMTHRMAVRTVDMSTTTVRELEEYLINKTVQNRHVLKVERISKMGRLQMAKFRGASRAQIIVAVLGAVVLFEEATFGGIADGIDTLKGSTLFIPPMKEMLLDNDSTK